jgi:replicative DNA helicase
MKHLIFIALLIVTVCSCKPTKQITEIKETIKVDTFTRDVDRFIYRSVHDTLTIENPCDSLSLKDFYYKTNLPQGKIIIRSLKGNIQATIDIDSIVNVYESKYKSSLLNSTDKTIKFVRTNIIPQWALMTIFIETLIIGLYLYFRLMFPK